MTGRGRTSGSTTETKTIKILMAGAGMKAELLAILVASRNASNCISGKAFSHERYSLSGLHTIGLLLLWRVLVDDAHLH